MLLLKKSQSCGNAWEQQGARTPRRQPVPTPATGMERCWVSPLGILGTLPRAPWGG